AGADRPVFEPPHCPGRPLMLLDLTSIQAALVLPISMVAAFVATTTLVLALTTPYETPAMRLRRYTRLTRPGSPGVDAVTLSLRERLIAPALRALFELAARATPSRARKTVNADLTMAGLQMNATAFLGVRTLLMFAIPSLTALYAISDGKL